MSAKIIISSLAIQQGITTVGFDTSQKGAGEVRWRLGFQAGQA
jgi:hypothetical protein